MAKADDRDSRPTLLVVDDDQLMQRLISATLRGGPFRVLAAGTALEGLRLAREHRPALIFLDLRLGSDNGLRVCRLLKSEEATRAIRIVILSGQDDPITRVRARRAGADRFFAKPFSPLAIWQTVDELVEA
ncbi:MAG TPA: response regulator [Chloroflexota bacterium]|jgi:CheY-like chemotaxis protein